MLTKDIFRWTKVTQPLWMAVFLRTLVQLPSFSSDLPNTNEDIAPQSQALQAFVLWQEGGGGGGGGGAQTP